MKILNILFVTPSYKPAYVYGGPTVSMSELAEALVLLGHNVSVYTTTANGKEELDVPVGEPLAVHGVTVHYFRRITKDHTHISPALWQALNKSMGGFDIVHLHSWWSLLIFGAAAICSRHHRKFILSPRGMLGGYSFTHQHSGLKKMLHQLSGKRLLRSSYLHATTQLEWDDCKKVNPSWEGFIAHNLVTLPKETVEKKTPGAGVLKLGFLSRVDHKKGLDILFHALATVTFPFQLQIAGSGDETYIQSLKSLAVQLGIQDRIQWLGWKSGLEKFEFLQSVDLFVLTSHNENFAVAVVESLSAGTAVLVSEHVGLASYVSEHNLGWVCRLSAVSVAEKLECAYRDALKLKSISAHAPVIIRQHFNKQHLAKQYVDAYLGCIQNIDAGKTVPAGLHHQQPA